MSATDGTTWEYRVVKGADEEALNALGDDGWELVGGAGDGPALVFKRPRPSFREQVTLDQKRRYYALWGVTPQADDERARP